MFNPVGVYPGSLGTIAACIKCAGHHHRIAERIGHAIGHRSAADLARYADLDTRNVAQQAVLPVKVKRAS